MSAIATFSDAVVRLTALQASLRRAMAPRPICWCVARVALRPSRPSSGAWAIASAGWNATSRISARCCAPIWATRHPPKPWRIWFEESPPATCCCPPHAIGCCSGCGRRARAPTDCAPRLPERRHGDNRAGTGRAEGTTNRCKDIAITYPPDRAPIVIAAHHDSRDYTPRIECRHEAVLTEVAQLAVRWVAGLRAGLHGCSGAQGVLNARRARSRASRPRGKVRSAPSWS